MMMDIVSRVGKTFVEAAIACLGAALIKGIDITDKTAVLGLMISVLAAGAAAAWNILLQIFRDMAKGGNDHV
jgi:hypothetical protein